MSLRFLLSISNPVRYTKATRGNLLHCTVLYSHTGAYFYGCRFWKKRAEEELQRSGLDYTIIRPGGGDGRGRAWMDCFAKSRDYCSDIAIRCRFGKQ